MKIVSLELGKTYKSPSGDMYETLSKVSLMFSDTKVFVVRKNNKEYGTLPIFADYEGWEEIPVNYSDSNEDFDGGYVDFDGDIAP